MRQPWQLPRLHAVRLEAGLCVRRFDVAAVLGCPVGTVKSRLARARQALRRLLRDYAP